MPEEFEAHTDSSPQSETSYEGTDQGLADLDTDDGQASTGQSATEENLPFHEHPRWKEVMSERDTARQEAAAKANELEQVRQRLAALEPYAPVADEFRNAGLADAAAIRNFTEQQNLQTYRQNLINAVEAGAIDPQVAEAQWAAAETKYNAAQQNLTFQVKQQQLDAQLAKLQKLEMDEAVNAAKAKYTDLDPDEWDDVREMAAKGVGTIDQIAQKLNTRAVTRQERAIAAYNAKKANDAKSPPAEGSGGTVPSRSGVPSVDDPNFTKWFHEQANKTARAKEYADY